LGRYVIHSEGRWTQKLRAYLAHVHGGAYLRRYGSRSLRILTVTIGEKRVVNLMRTTAKICRPREQGLFWFTTLDQVSPETALEALVWQVPGQDGPLPLLSTAVAPATRSSPAPLLLFHS
jgi:hypothetical protein